jgi:hypothetical protein
MIPAMTARLAWLRGLHAMRDGLLEQLADDELGRSTGGGNVSFGQLFMDLAALQQSYITSLRTRDQQWPDATSDEHPTVAALTRLFHKLDAEMELAVTSADQRTDAVITRPDGEVRTPDEQLEIYTQALFIFLGKAVVYMRAADKDLPPFVAHYIG